MAIGGNRRIGSFNLHVFGPKKAGNKQFIKKLVQIIQRYDLIALQEIFDIQSDVINILMGELNRDEPGKYKVVFSPREGVSRRERTAIIYRSDVFKVEPLDLGAYSAMWAKFERYPFGAWVTSLEQPDVQFVFLVVHVKPSNAVEEMENLYTCLQILQQQFPDILIGGDFNSFGQYVSRRELENLRLRTDSDYQWIIEDDVDTTVASSHNTYDRLIAFGKLLQSILVPNSGRAFQFWDLLEMSRADASGISDHLPVEVEFEVSRLCLSAEEKQKREEAKERRMKFLRKLGRCNPFRDIMSYEDSDEDTGTASVESQSEEQGKRKRTDDTGKRHKTQNSDSGTGSGSSSGHYRTSRNSGSLDPVFNYQGKQTIAYGTLFGLVAGGTVVLETTTKGGAVGTVVGGPVGAIIGAGAGAAIATTFVVGSWLMRRMFN